MTSSTTTTPTGTTTNSYGYDAAGDTTTRDLNGTTQSLLWDDEGHLASDELADGTTASYLYDAGGNRLLTRDATGTTLFLGDTELHLDKGTTSVTATRYYTWLGQTIALHTAGGDLQWVLDDAHNTAITQIDSATQAVTYRRTDPFGNDRATTMGPWAGDHGFVGGVQDTTTDLTHLGARDYDPTTGRFTSLDPVLELTDPQQINGYAYAADNPVTGADPDGLQTEECATGELSCSHGTPDPPGNSGDGGSGEGKPVVRNGGKSNVSSECGGGATANMSAHDASVCQSGYAVQEWAKENKVHGYVTVDIGKSGWRANYIEGASGNGKADFGQADLILWTPDGVYIWEVKPNNEYGKRDGPIDLNRYVSKLQTYMDSKGDGREVFRGPGVAAKSFVSNQGKGRVWSGDSNKYPGMRFYGTDKKRTRRTAPPAPGASPSATPESTESPQPMSTPNPMPQPPPVPYAGVGATGGSILVAVVGGALKSIFSGLSEGPACALGGDC
ncbi:RHS repeat-associated core domain-containing protein [Streptomyces sp. CA2R106]|uniref:RHS repeat-associated core domain-containing protein n=1 Tax=Streptomyces sp. CA2R106 TaxID=3120153 RepID=UPI00300AF9AB